MPTSLFASRCAWFYPIEGQAHVGLAWSWDVAGGFSSSTSSLFKWQYLEYTHYKTDLGGPLLYGLSNVDKFYVDGVWLNVGTMNLSPYAPRNGFQVPVPEPTTMLLLGSGLIGLAGYGRRKFLKK